MSTKHRNLNIEKFEDMLLEFNYIPFLIRWICKPDQFGKTQLKTELHKQFIKGKYYNIWDIYQFCKKESYRMVIWFTDDNHDVIEKVAILNQKEKEMVQFAETTTIKQRE